MKRSRIPSGLLAAIPIAVLSLIHLGCCCGGSDTTSVSEDLQEEEDQTPVEDLQETPVPDKEETQEASSGERVEGETETSIRVQVFSPKFNGNDKEEWDSGGEPDPSLVLTIDGKEHTLSEENKGIVEFLVPQPMLSQSSITVAAKESNFFSSPEIGTTEFSCIHAEAPCWSVAGSAIFQVIPGSIKEENMLEDFQKESESRFLDASMERLEAEACVEPTEACALLLEAFSSFESYSAQAEQKANTLARAYLDSKQADLDSSCAETPDSCCASGLAHLKLTEDKHLVSVAAEDDILAFSRAVRKKVRSQCAQDLENTASKGAWTEFEEVSVKVRSAESRNTYNNAKQHHCFPESTLTADGYYVIVKLSVKNTSNTLQSMTKTGTPYGVDAELVDVFGLEEKTDGELEGYIEHNSGGTRGCEGLFFDVRTGETWNTTLAFEVPDTAEKTDLYLKLDGRAPDSEIRAVWVKLF